MKLDFRSQRVYLLLKPSTFERLSFDRLNKDVKWGKKRTIHRRF